MEKLTPYERVQRQIKANELDLIVAVTPPRTGSTLLYTILSRSTDIDIGISDPQVDPYTQIYEESSNIPRRNDRPNKLILKMMSHWLRPKTSYEDLYSLSDKVVLSIRNPLLSTESRIKRFIDSLSMKAQPEVSNWLINNLKPRESFTSRVNDGLVLNDQVHLLDFYAQDFSYPGWNQLVAQSYRDQRYVDFGDILNSDNTPTGFSTEQLGWQDLDEQADYLNKAGREFIICDSTELRLNPRAAVSELSERIAIHYCDDMMSWDKKELGIELTETLDVDKAVQYTWYRSLAESSGVNPPKERSPKLQDFPVRVAQYLNTIAIPTYYRLYNLHNRVQIPNDNIAAFEETQIDPFYANIARNNMIVTNW